MMRKKSHDPAPNRISRLVRKPWLFASAILGLDIAMLAAGMALSGRSDAGIIYTANGDSIGRDDPMAFFGIVAAVVLGIECVLLALMLAGAFSRGKRRAGVILGSAGLLVLSLVMVGSSAFMAMGAPVKQQRYYSYSDETLRLIIEESEPYFGEGSTSFYMTTSAENGKAVLLAKTDISDYADGAERYNIVWKNENTLQIGFADGINYRTLTITVDKSLLE